MIETREATRVPAAPQPRGRRTPVVAVAVTLLVLLAAEAGVRALASRLPEPSPWTQRLPGMMLEQMRALGASGGVDVAFLGSSVVNNAFDPATLERETGLTSYNAGLQRAGVVGFDAWAREMVVPSLRPRIAVIGVVSRDLNDNGPLQRDFLAEYLASPGRAHALGTETLAMRAERIASSISALVRYRRYLRRPADLADHVLRGNPALEPPIVLGARGEPLGADANAPFAIRDWQYPHRNGELLAYETTRSVRALADLVAWLRAEEVTVVLADMPVIEDVYVPYHPRGAADLDAYRTGLRRLAADLDVPLATLDHGGADAAGIAVDDIHLNRAGARALTERLARFLRENALIERP